MKTIQLRGAGARYTNENGIETFSTQPGDERAEARIDDDHRTGTWQFEGWVNVKAGVNGGCIHQVFKFLMIVAYPNDGGELRQHSYQRLAATGMYDKWVRVNTIHDADAGRADVYIDGTWRGMVRSNEPGAERLVPQVRHLQQQRHQPGRAVAEREVLQGRQGRPHGLSQ